MSSYVQTSEPEDGDFVLVLTSLSPSLAVNMETPQALLLAVGDQVRKNNVGATPF